MQYPISRILEAIAKLKVRSLSHGTHPVTPDTDDAFQAFHDFCQLWSQAWGYPSRSTAMTDQTNGKSEITLIEGQ